MTTIRVTKNAWMKMRDILFKSKNNLGFIYSASSGGCNGFNFELNLIKEEDYKRITNIKFHSVLTDKNKVNGEITKMYIDPTSELLLHGTSIDYIKEDYVNDIFESKFIFEIDKNLMTSCGCGISFSPK